GTYVLRLTATDSVLTSTSDVTITVNPAATNTAPVVNAGTNQTITLPATANLSATTSDDGLPNGTLTITWSKFSGPGTVIFGDVSQLASTAIFSTSGTYVLRLTASDTALSSTSDVTISVNPAPNAAPVMNAGANQTITLPSGANLPGTASDDWQPNGTLLTTWSQLSGPGTLTLGEATAATTTATS